MSYETLIFWNMEACYSVSIMAMQPSNLARWWRQQMTKVHEIRGAILRISLNALYQNMYNVPGHHQLHKVQELLHPELSGHAPLQLWSQHGLKRRTSIHLKCCSVLFLNSLHHKDWHTRLQCGSSRHKACLMVNIGYYSSVLWHYPACIHVFVSWISCTTRTDTKGCSVGLANKA